jgi:hypothetical protein
MDKECMCREGSSVEGAEESGDVTLRTHTHTHNRNIIVTGVGYEWL